MIETNQNGKYANWWIVYEYLSICLYEEYKQRIDWCNTTIGVEDKDWKAEWNRYLFKNKEDAMLFELTWI